MENQDRWSAGETCSRARNTEQLSKLQRIFDRVWMELRANGTVSGPRHPQTSHGKIARRVICYEIGRQVMNYADDHQMTDAQIAQAVVRRMSLTYRFEPAFLDMIASSDDWTLSAREIQGHRCLEEGRQQMSCSHCGDGASLG
jgi:hypothetical protein